MTPSPRRRLPLLLGALLVPSIVMAVMGARLVVQERELTDRRMADRRRAVARDLGQSMTVALERLRREALSGSEGGHRDPTSAPSTGALVLAAPIVGGELLLPWEHDGARGRADRFRTFLADERIRRGERAEIVSRDPERATIHYGEALRSERAAAVRGDAGVATEREAYVRLLLSRALRQAARSDEAREHERFVLEQPAAVADEHGIPLALYAAHRMSNDGSSVEVRQRLEALAATPGWLSPLALHLMRDLGRAGGEPHTALLEVVEARIRRAEHVLALSRDVRVLEAQLADDRTGSRWIAHGEAPWLVGRVGGVGSIPPLLVVVDPRQLIGELEREGALAEMRNVRLVTPAEPSALPLHPALPGLSALFDTPDDPTAAGRSRLQAAFLGSSLVLVLALSTLGAWLLWRDVQREVHMAAMRSSFVSSVSHELRTPLAAIRMFADMLLEHPRDGPERGYVETIAGESERLTRLVDNVLDFARIERGRTRYRMESVDLADTVRGAAGALRYLVEKDRFHLALELDDAVPPVRADRDAMEQAVLNLLTNAMKYSGKSRSIELGLARRNGQAVIEVRDRGIGVAPADRERIFEAFYRGTDGGAETVPGTGLGLTVVRHVMEAHGGRVTLEASPTGGSIFRLHVPLEAEGDVRNG